MSLSDEIEDWLAEDIIGHVDEIGESARLGCRDWRRDNLVIEDETGRHYVDIVDCLPNDLRAVATAHEVAAAKLLEDAALLRAYADHLAGGSTLGVQLTEHFCAMRVERARRSAESQNAWATANAENGVTTRFGDATGSALVRARLLTVDDVRGALVDGRLLRVKGIGPARFSQIVRELAGEAL